MLSIQVQQAFIEKDYPDGVIGKLIGDSGFI